LTLEGDRAFSQNELESGFASDLGTWWPLSPAPHFDAAAFQGDVDRLTAFYRGRGYFDVRISDTEVIPNGKQGVDVRVRIDEGKPFTIRGLVIDGWEDADSALQRELAHPGLLREGQVFTEQAYLITKAHLVERAREYAYAQAAVRGRAQVDLAGGVVDVSLHLDLGARYTYGAFEVIGNKTVPRARVLRELQDLMVEGGAFKASDFETARARLQDLGVFGNVQVSALAPDSSSETVPVVVSVAEVPFRMLHAGVGVGVDVEREEAHVSVGYTDRNFLGGLKRSRRERPRRSILRWREIAPTSSAALRSACTGLPSTNRRRHGTPAASSAVTH